MHSAEYRRLPGQHSMLRTQPVFLLHIRVIYPQASSKLDTHIKTKDYSQSSDEELLAACKEFESYFLEQIFKEMQKKRICKCY